MCWQHVTNVQMCCPIVTGEPNTGGKTFNGWAFLIFVSLWVRKEEGGNVSMRCSHEQERKSH